MLYEVRQYCSPPILQALRLNCALNILFIMLHDILFIMLHDIIFIMLHDISFIMIHDILFII